MTLHPSQVRVLSFDCYGTLVDWETGIWDALQPLLALHPTAAPRREAALARYGEIEPLVEGDAPTRPYEHVLADVHARLAKSFDLTSSAALDAQFAASVPQWPAFSDTAEALRRLATKYKLVILSNVSEAGIRASTKKLGVTFDAVYTAERIGSYKPDLATFKYLLDHLDADFDLLPTALLHVAQSLFHDHAPADHLGLHTAWIDRRGQASGASSGATMAVERDLKIDMTFPTLEGLADALVGTTDAQDEG